jgi:hypothetical protein
MEIHGEPKNTGQEQNTVLTLNTKTYKMYFLFEKHVSCKIACENCIMKLGGGGEDAKYTAVIKMF